MAIPIPLIIVMVTIVLFGVLIVIYGSKPKKEQGAAQERLFRKMYETLSTFFLTSGRMQKIIDQLSALSIYNRKEMQQIAVKYFLMSSSISIILVVAGIILFNDTISILVCITFAIMINTIMIDKQVEKVNMRVYQALKHSISSIRQEYLRLGSVPEAVEEADIPALLQRPFDNIYSILTSADGELQLLKFYESSPFRALQTLAGICYNINNSGDDKDEYGQSNFVQALTMLSSDVNSEIERLTMMKQRFGIIEYLTVVPIFCMNFIESYFIDTMPGTALIYNGLIGYLSRTVTLILCATCYTIVARINSATSVKEDDRSPWEKKLLEKPGFRQFIYNIEPKNAKKRRLELKLKKALSKKGPEHIYTEKVVISVISFAFAVIAMLSIVDMARDYYLNSTDQLSLVADESMDAYSKEDILTLDNEYLNRTYEWDDEVFKETIKGYMPSLSDMQILDQMSRIRNKEASLETAYFHWYYMVICILICVLCWFIPDAQLKMRILLVKTEAEDDFLQLQTLMAILMNMNIDTLDALWQMCQHSRIHKDMLLYCYHSYPSNPELELARLKSKTPIIEFQRFLGKLQLTISDLSLAEAYSDLRIERDHMLRIREMSMIATINKKRKICGPISMTPFIMLVLGEFLIPIGYLGVKEFTKALGSMGG